VEALVVNHLSPENLVVEITESLIMDHDNVLPQLARLRDIGIAVSIDDFGTGYSSLSRLSELPIDVLKVDRSFVTQMNSDAPQTSLFASIVALARSLDLSVVVEGVETAEQAASLQSIRCDHIQGYFYSPPLAPDAFSAFADSFCERDYVLGA
jgi:diguanylate cyclase